MTSLERIIETELADKVMELVAQMVKEKRETKPLMTEKELAEWLGVSPVQ